MKSFLKPCEHGNVLYALLTNKTVFLNGIDWSNKELSLAKLEGRMNETALMDGIANSSNDAVIKLLDSCPHISSHVNIASSYTNRNNTPLILSMSKGWNHIDDAKKSFTPHSAVIQKLIEKGANLHARDIDGRTALHYACLHKDREAIKFLIDNGAKSDITDINGQTPLNYIFYDIERASTILRDITVDSFTLKKAYFAPDYNRTPLILALLPHADVELILLKARINKQLTDALMPIYQYASLLAKVNNIELLFVENFSDEIAEMEYPNNIEKIRAVRELYKIYMRLSNIASNIDYSSKDNAHDTIGTLMITVAAEQNNPLLSGKEHNLLKQIGYNISFLTTTDALSANDKESNKDNNKTEMKISFKSLRI